MSRQSPAHYLEILEETNTLKSTYPAQSSSIKHTIDELLNWDDVNEYEDTDVTCVNDDCFQTMFELQNEGLNPVVLIMSSMYNAGGGFTRGSYAQEEQFFYSSNISWIVNENDWPLNQSVVYVPKVTFFRNESLEITDPQEHACIFACVPRSKIFNEYNISTILETIFLTALRYKHDALVLSAIGSGAYGNPVKPIIFLFEKMVNKYYKYFKKIVFAVHGDNFPYYNETFGDGTKVDETLKLGSQKNKGKKGRRHY